MIIKNKYVLLTLMFTKLQAASFNVFKVKQDTFNVTESRINPSCKINVTSLSSMSQNVYKLLHIYKKKLKALVNFKNKN